MIVAPSTVLEVAAPSIIQVVAGFGTRREKRTGANFNNHVLRMITEGQSQLTHNFWGF